MQRRAELVDETRLRITEAAIRLHTTIGPAATTLSAVAQEAGVTRVTLYRHFSSQDELFAACRSHWITLNRPPDHRAWVGITPLEERLTTALAQLYEWYAAHGHELLPMYRDVASMPVSTQRAMKADQTAIVEALTVGAGLRGTPARRLRAAVGHALSFWTWHSLVVEQGLRLSDAVYLASQFAVAALPSTRPASVSSSA